MGWERSPLGWSWWVGSRASPLGLPGTSTQGMIPGQPRRLADLHIWRYSHIGPEIHDLQLWRRWVLNKALGPSRTR